MRGQSEATLQTGRRDQKVWYQLRPRSKYLTPWMTHNIIAYFHRYDWLCHLATFHNSLLVRKKVAKWQSQSYLWKYAIILCVIQGVKYFDKVTSWPQLISNLLVTPACLQCCFWLALHLFTPQVFLFSISLLFVNLLPLHISIYIKQMILWILVLKNSSPQFFKLPVQNDTSINNYRLCIFISFAGGPSYDNYQSVV